MKYSAAPPLVIIRDSREAHVDAGDRPSAVVWPTIGGRHIETVREKLDAGDYAIKGLEHVAAIELKKPSDLWNTCFGSRLDSTGDRAANLDRFRDALTRLATRPFAAILIAGSQEDFYRGRGLVGANGGDRVRAIFSLFRILDALRTDFGVHIVWSFDDHGSHARAAEWIGWALSRVWEQAHERTERCSEARRRGVVAPWVGMIKAPVVEQVA